jgi:hypothetical protein
VGLSFHDILLASRLPAAKLGSVRRRVIWRTPFDPVSSAQGDGVFHFQILLDIAPCRRDDSLAVATRLSPAFVLGERKWGFFIFSVASALVIVLVSCGEASAQDDAMKKELEEKGHFSWEARLTLR